MNKICTKCKIEKDIMNFSKSRTRSDGLQQYCRDCNHVYRLNNLKRIQDHQKFYQQKNGKTIYQKRKTYLYQYLNEHREQLNTAVRRNRQLRRSTDVTFKLLQNYRKRIWDALNDNTKSEKTAILLGCSNIELQNHLQSQFKEGMTWQNYGLHGWHIDHIIPCDSFDLSDPEQQKKCFHYTNLQPLWAKENWIKGNKTCKC
jgi:chaperonin cofactor prefoldin